MQEQYYLIPKSAVDEIMVELKTIKGLKQSVIDNYISKTTLVDLSDSAIEKEGKEYASKIHKSHVLKTFREYSKNDYIAGLKNLKNKLNEQHNKTEKEKV